MYGTCSVCSRGAQGPHGLCGLHYAKGPEYVASQGWSADDPGVVYLAEWPIFLKVGIGIDPQRAELWARHGAELYAVQDMGTRANALHVETAMKNFLYRIGVRAFESGDVAPRYLQAHTGWTECFRVDSLDREAVRGEFDRLTHPGLEHELSTSRGPNG
jgi:hypothetical protein